MSSKSKSTTIPARTISDYFDDRYSLSSHPPFGESKDIPRLGFGYLRDDKWLREFALKHHEVVPPTLVDKVDLDIKATEYLMVQLEQMMRMSIKIDRTYYHVFYLGTNKTKEHLKRAMNLENVDQLKRLFDTEEDPKWIRINHTIWSTFYPLNSLIQVYRWV